MEVELSKMQLILLENICKKGWGGFSKPCSELDEMVKNGLLIKTTGPFGDVVYHPTTMGKAVYKQINK